MTPSESSGGTRRATQRFALTQGLCEEADILTSELVEGENGRLSCDGGGFSYGMICLPGATPNLPSEQMEAEVIGLVNEAVKREDSCEGQHLSKAEDEVKEEEDEEVELARYSSFPLPRLRSLVNDSTSSSESAEGSPPVSLSAAETSLCSVEEEADDEPDEEDRPRKRPMHRGDASRPAIARISRLRPNTGEAGPRYPERRPRPRCRGQEGSSRPRPRPRRACADKAIDYGSRGNWVEIE